jgi:hypothetical protein
VNNKCRDFHHNYLNIGLSLAKKGGRQAEH